MTLLIPRGKFTSYPAVYKIIRISSTMKQMSNIIYTVMKWAILHNDFGIKVYFDANAFVLDFECRTFTCNRVFLHCCITTFIGVKDLNTSSTTESCFSTPVVFSDTSPL